MDRVSYGLGELPICIKIFSKFIPEQGLGARGEWRGASLVLHRRHGGDEEELELEAGAVVVV